MQHDLSTMQEFIAKREINEIQQAMFKPSKADNASFCFFFSCQFQTKIIRPNLLFQRTMLKPYKVENASFFLFFFMSIPDQDNQTHSIAVNYNEKKKKDNKHKQPKCKPLKLLMEVGKANLVSHCFLMNSRLKVTVEPMSSEHKI